MWPQVTWQLELLSGLCCLSPSNTKPAFMPDFGLPIRAQASSVIVPVWLAPTSAQIPALRAEARELEGQWEGKKEQGTDRLREASAPEEGGRHVRACAGVGLGKPQEIGFQQ